VAGRNLIIKQSIGGPGITRGLVTSLLRVREPRCSILLTHVLTSKPSLVWDSTEKANEMACRLLSLPAPYTRKTSRIAAAPTSAEDRKQPTVSSTFLPSHNDYRYRSGDRESRHCFRERGGVHPPHCACYGVGKECVIIA
jgi:hypothetical protein